MIVFGSLLFDGTGREPLRNAGILIKDGIIQGILSADEIRGKRDEEIVEVEGGTVLPGLIDPHVHLCFSASTDPLQELNSDDDNLVLLRARENAYKALSVGITTVRDCGGRGYLTVLLREAIRQGITQGCRILSSGMPITTTGGHLHFLGFEKDSIPELRKAVRELHKSRVDFVKVCVTGGGMTVGSDPFEAQYSKAELRAIVEEAHRLKKRVAGHAHGTRAILDAIHAGFDTIEHCSWLQDGEAQFADDAVELMLSHGTTVCVTIGAIDRSSDKAGIWYKTQETRRTIFRQMREAGVPFIVGSDAGVRNTPITDFYCSMCEFASLFGIPMLDVVRTVTQGHARALGVDHILGTLEPGKLADVIVVDGNPFESPETLRNVKTVLKEGKVIFA